VKISDLEPNKWYQGNLEAINRELTIGGDWRRGREGPRGCCCWSLPGHGEPRLDAARGRGKPTPGRHGENAVPLSSHTWHLGVGVERVAECEGGGLCLDLTFFSSVNFGRSSSRIWSWHLWGSYCVLYSVWTLKVGPVRRSPRRTHQNFWYR
jgi:hypothetical protein